MKFIILVSCICFTSAALGKIGIYDDIVTKNSGRIVGHITSAGTYLNRGALKGMMTSSEIDAFKKNATKKQRKLLNFLTGSGKKGKRKIVHLSEFSDEQRAIIEENTRID